MQTETERGKQFVMARFQCVLAEHRDQITVTRDLWGDTPGSGGGAHNLYFFVEGENTPNIVVFWRSELEDAAHPHNTEVRQEIEERIREKISSLGKEVRPSRE